MILCLKREAHASIVIVEIYGEQFFTARGKGSRDAARFIVRTIRRQNPYPNPMVSWCQLHYVGKVAFDSLEEHHTLLNCTTQRMAVALPIVDPDRKVGRDKMVFNDDAQLARMRSVFGSVHGNIYRVNPSGRILS